MIDEQFELIENRIPSDAAIQGEFFYLKAI
jgi:hypothetical protein